MRRIFVRLLAARLRRWRWFRWLGVTKGAGIELLVLLVLVAFGWFGLFFKRKGKNSVSAFVKGEWGGEI